MTLELGDASSVRCVTSDLICELDFQGKGFFSGTPNSVVGKIKKESTQEILYEICGQWSGELNIKKYTPPEKSSLTGLLVKNKASTTICYLLYFSHLLELEVIVRRRRIQANY
jgi:hypothetical protein